MLCQVHLTAHTPEEKDLVNYLFFHPYDKVTEKDGAVILNYGGGNLCRGKNDFGEGCKECRYAPLLIRKILGRQDSYKFGV
jgi:hypothetical protein